MSRYLLDTHTALFWWAGGDQLGRQARAALGEDDATILVSAASGWEVTTKFRIGKLDDFGDPAVNMPKLMIEHGFEWLDVTAAHGLLGGSLPGEHRDPFDRLIAAQAVVENLVLVTRDRHMAAFGCKVLW